MQLTAEEEAHTRQVAAQIGRNPDDLIREGEQVKASGRRSAQQQAEGCAAFRRRWRPRDGSPARTQDPCADPSSWWRTATTARGVARANGKRSQADDRHRVRPRTELGRLGCANRPDPVVAHRGPAPSGGAGTPLGGAGFSWPGSDPALERQPSRDPELEAGS